MPIKLFAMMLAGSLFAAGAAVACPNYNLSGESYEVSGSYLYSPRSLTVRAGGPHSITACGIRPNTDRGRGYVTEAPDFTIHLSGMSGYSLVMSVESECDSVLLINTGAKNWYYDDDDNGALDARISLSRPSNGWLDIWVGTHDGAVCDARLVLETFNR
ncbi:hypothetical protein [Boseongicola aestuarii]|uniref:Uncharacterized protein n=1 Tax=Boseongicola aestuarii TaxID=1470561 RepID=A0A238J6A7_9RHOB|nr:hypothetical protein [Boseongicola aestuarii]SMX25490.1 hypothetical protein BOA8489_03633 [Boseongicola aestuarii]